MFGCAFDDNIVARHISVTDINNIEPLQSSKYVQSDVGDTFADAKELLDNGKTVFYTGTPCQISGLYAFLGKDYDNLLTADLICHGVPSPLLFKRYIDWLGHKNGGKIIYYNFRSKVKFGWGLQTKTKTKTKTKTYLPSTDPYYNSFLNNITLRECCYVCKFANVNRVADISLGDFWGVEIAHPKFFDRRGVSVVFANTEKGLRYIKDALDDFEIVESSLNAALSEQTALQKPEPRPLLRDTAYKDVKNESVDIFNGISYRIPIKSYIKSLIKKVLPVPIVFLIGNAKRKLKTHMFLSQLSV